MSCVEILQLEIELLRASANGPIAQAMLAHDQLRRVMRLASETRRSLRMLPGASLSLAEAILIEAQNRVLDEVIGTIGRGFSDSRAGHESGEPIRAVHSNRG